MTREIPYRATGFNRFETYRCFKATLCFCVCMLMALYTWTGTLIFDVSVLIDTEQQGVRLYGIQGVYFVIGLLFKLMLFFLLAVFLLWLMRLLPHQQDALYKLYVQEVQEYNRAAAINAAKSDDKQDLPVKDQTENAENDERQTQIISGVTVTDIRALFDQNNPRYRPSLAAAVWLWCSFESKGVPVGMTPKQEAERRLGAEIPPAISTNWTDKEEGEILKMVNWQKSPIKQG